LIKILGFIATDKFHTDSIKQHFKSKTVFETKDIVDFYELFEKGLISTTINWRIYTLVKEGVLQRIGRGKFSLGEGRKYIPEISSVTKSIFKKLKAKFPYANFCVWNTSALNEFMQHQPNRFFISVETDRETSNSAFYFLREMKKLVFIEPTEDILKKYIVNEKEIVVIKTLISEAPTHYINEVETASLEKILVDVFCNDVIFSAQQGAEMRTIFKEAFTKYTINQSKMLRYADRRRKKKELNLFAKTISNLWQQ
jgi:hypothetical protein